MAQLGYTPIQLYYSTTATNTPAAGDLANGELAINIPDGKLFYKDGATVKVIASTASTAGTVSSVSVVSANGFAGTVATSTTTPAITLTTTITGILKGNGSAISAAVSGTDYAPATTGTAILYGNGSGGFNSVTIGTGVSFTGGTLSATGSGGTVTAVSVVSANGFAGTSSGGTTPALTLTTTITGIVKGNGTSLSAAVSGTDYVAPSAYASANGLTMATARLLGRTTAATGAAEEITVGSGLTLSAGTLTATGSGGTVTSVALTAPSIFTVTGSPITSSGTLALTYSGTALPILNGGTGATTASAAFNALSPLTTQGDTLYGGASGAGTRLAIGTAGQVLTVNAGATAPQWSTPTTGTVTSVGLSAPAIFTVTNSPVTSSGTLTLSYSGTALPVANGGTNATSAGITAFNNITGYTASGATGTTSTNIVFSTSPTLVTPTLGVASATSINKVAFTAPATSATLTLVDGSTLATSGAFSTTLTATGTTTVTLPTTGTLATLAGTETLTNKRITPRVTSITGAAGGTITPTSDASDQYNITALGATASFAVPSGTPTDGQKLSIRIYSAAAQTISWTTTSTGYRIIGTTLPTTTGVGKTYYVGCVWNAADSFWDVVAVATQA